MEFKTPSILKNSNGDIRKVGFELEFGGADLDTTANCIMALYGGKRIVHNKFLQEVADTSLGTFHLKMDARMLTEKSYENILEKLGIDTSDKAVEELMETVASFIVPYEVGAPPVPFTEVHRIDELRDALHNKQAEGTKVSVFNAYATHINAELPDFETSTVLNYLRAFVLLYPVIYAKSEVAIRRRLSSYINPFPQAYIDLILDENYKPGMERIIDDYHAYNPDRNRPLDMYPAFACINKEMVGRMKDIGNVKPRPTFHYRLPNCEIDEPGWSLATVWNYWVAIENLAADPTQISVLSAAYRDLAKNTFMGFNGKWIEQTEKLLK